MIISIGNQSFSVWLLARDKRKKNNTKQETIIRVNISQNNTK